MRHGRERFFLGLGQILADRKPSQDELNEFGKLWGVEFLGPPFSVSVNSYHQRFPIVRS
jgi:hypothetical protein